MCVKLMPGEIFGIKMTAEQFRQLALKLFGPGRGWQSRCAEALRTDRSCISRYIAGSVPIPGPVAVAMQSFVERARITSLTLK